MQWLLFPVAILAGMLMVVQSGCNGMLERILDRPVMVGVVSQALGLTTLVFAGIATGELGFPDSSRIMQGPWWGMARRAVRRCFAVVAADCSTAARRRHLYRTIHHCLIGLVFWCWLRRCFASCSEVMPRATA